MNTLKLARLFVATILLAAIGASPVSAQNLSSLSVDDDITTVRQTSFAADVIPPPSSPETDLARIVDELKVTADIPTETLALSKTEWNAFGGRLEAALATDHLGLNHAALRLVIAYGDNFNLKEEAETNLLNAA